MNPPHKAVRRPRIGVLLWTHIRAWVLFSSRYRVDVWRGKAVQGKSSCWIWDVRYLFERDPAQKARRLGCFPGHKKAFLSFLMQSRLGLSLPRRVAIPFYSWGCSCCEDGHGPLKPGGPQDQASPEPWWRDNMGRIRPASAMGPVFLWGKWIMDFCTFCIKEMILKSLLRILSMGFESWLWCGTASIDPLSRYRVGGFFVLWGEKLLFWGFWVYCK